MANSLEDEDTEFIDIEDRNMRVRKRMAYGEMTSKNIRQLSYPRFDDLVEVMQR